MKWVNLFSINNTNSFVLWSKPIQLWTNSNTRKMIYPSKKCKKKESKPNSLSIQTWFNSNGVHTPTTKILSLNPWMEYMDYWYSHTLRIPLNPSNDIFHKWAMYIHNNSDIRNICHFFKGRGGLLQAQYRINKKDISERIMAFARNIRLCPSCSYNYYRSRRRNRQFIQRILVFSLFFQWTHLKQTFFPWFQWFCSDTFLTSILPIFPKKDKVGSTPPINRSPSTLRRCRRAFTTLWRGHPHEFY